MLTVPARGIRVKLHPLSSSLLSRLLLLHTTHRRKNRLHATIGKRDKQSKSNLTLAVWYEAVTEVHVKHPNPSVCVIPERRKARTTLIGRPLTGRHWRHPWRHTVCKDHRLGWGVLDFSPTQPLKISCTTFLYLAVPLIVFFLFLIFFPLLFYLYIHFCAQKG